MISVLICTYNRKELLKRAVESVLRQTYGNFEIVIIDDCSEEIPDLPDDLRIRYYRNEKNQGAIHGDRVHIKRFVNELSKGEYFLYLCDDDYLINGKLFESQMNTFDANPTAAMVIGSQLSHFIPPGDIQFHNNVYPNHFMPTDEFLAHFSENPISCNIIIGATLYNKEVFLRCGALQSVSGSKWQSGYEMLIAPGCYGNVFYLNEPCIMVEVRPDNASFKRTQKEHYMDSVVSLKSAFKKAIIDFPEKNMKKIYKRTLDNIGKSFLSNAEYIKEYGRLSMCSEENMRNPVTQADLL